MTAGTKAVTAAMVTVTVLRLYCTYVSKNTGSTPTADGYLDQNAIVILSFAIPLFPFVISTQIVLFCMEMKVQLCALKKEFI